MSDHDIRAVFAADGLTAAFYDAAIDANRIPEVAVAISEADWRAFLAGRKLWNGTGVVDYTPPALPVPLPDISDRQFARGLWGDGIITYQDFLGFIGPGTIPGPIQTIVNTLPDDGTGKPTPRKDAVGFLTGSKLYSFAHPLVEVFRQAMAAADPKWTPDYLRARWLVWATL